MWKPVKPIHKEPDFSDPKFARAYLLGLLEPYDTVYVIVRRCSGFWWYGILDPYIIKGNKMWCIRQATSTLLGLPVYARGGMWAHEDAPKGIKMKLPKGAPLSARDLSAMFVYALPEELWAEQSRFALHSVAL
jgi:hypothetical protein